MHIRHGNGAQYRAMIDFLRANVEAIGFCAGVLTTTAFAPQVLRTWRLGGEQLSWTMLALFGAGISLWFVYGWVLASVLIMLANGLTGLQVAAIVAIKLRSVRPARACGVFRKAVSATNPSPSLSSSR